MDCLVSITTLTEDPFIFSLGIFEAYVVQTVSDAMVHPKRLWWYLEVIEGNLMRNLGAQHIGCIHSQTQQLLSTQ